MPLPLCHTLSPHARLSLALNAQIKDFTFFAARVTSLEAAIAPAGHRGFTISVAYLDEDEIAEGEGAGEGDEGRTSASKANASERSILGWELMRIPAGECIL